MSDTDDSGKEEYGDEEEYDDETASPNGKEGEGVEPDADRDNQEEVEVDSDEIEEYGSEDDIPADKRLIMNVHCTEYDVVKKVGRKMLNFKYAQSSYFMVLQK